MALNATRTQDWVRLEMDYETVCRLTRGASPGGVCWLPELGKRPGPPTTTGIPLQHWPTTPQNLYPLFSTCRQLLPELRSPLQHLPTTPQNLDPLFSTCRQRQNTTPRGIPAQYSDEIGGRNLGRSHGNWPTQYSDAVTESNTKFSDTRDFCLWEEVSGS